jgi:hypothetical protein
MLFFLYQPGPLSLVVTIGAHPGPLSADAPAAAEKMDKTIISARIVRFMAFTSLCC